MKSLKLVLMLSLVTVFNAGCSGCAKVVKPHSAAPVQVQEARPVMVEKASEAPRAEAVVAEAAKEKSGDVFKWGNREEGK